MTPRLTAQAPNCDAAPRRGRGTSQSLSDILFRNNLHTPVASSLSVLRRIGMTEEKTALFRGRHLQIQNPDPHIAIHLVVRRQRQAAGLLIIVPRPVHRFAGFGHVIP